MWPDKLFPLKVYFPQAYFPQASFPTYFRSTGHIQWTGITTASKTTLISSCILLSLGTECIQVNPEKEMSNKCFTDFQEKSPSQPPFEKARSSVWNAFSWLPFLVNPCWTLTFKPWFSLQSLSADFSVFIFPLPNFMN